MTHMKRERYGEKCFYIHREEASAREVSLKLFYKDRSKKATVEYVYIFFVSICWETRLASDAD